ncbi:PQQ-dependent catabolism-associated beta-propeller protein [Legionella lansingensis]|uniref:Cytochrome D1 heme domain protein n=1 Tax=Legionella lansingensis TaxID=45067 RepID=A0A0W0VGN7_9GAMM|nr:ABC transporter substrate-binding protein [Legionella lansingensis]KTD19315.1 Cytochrome D1 heme domain protein [Legionella lansingensis]SNV50422.1 PQQ-dependent catabolism-associated beta-propeller protein [Legionella lansingensis]
MLQACTLACGLIISVFSFSSHATSTDVLAVVEENADRVSFYDPNDNSLSSLKLGFLPHEIAITKDGKTAYISNFGIRDYDSGSGTPGASISVIDIPNHLEKYRLYTFDPEDSQDYSQIDSAPHGVKLRPPFEKELYVNVEKGNKILVYDVDNRSIIKKINVSPNTHNIFFSPDGKVLWLMAGRDGVIRLDPDSGQITGTFTLPTPVRGLKYTPDNRYLMVSAVNQIVFIDPETLTLRKQFTNLGVGPILYSEITPDQKYILAPAAFDHQVVVIDVGSGKVVKRLITGLNPINVLVSPDAQFAYVSNATDKHLTKVDLKTFEFVSIPSHAGPNGLGFVPQFVYQPRKKLLLGALLPFTGSEDAKGREMMRGYEYWKLKITQARGLLIGKQAYDVDIVYLDTESKLDNVEKLTLELLNQYKVQALLSTYGPDAYAIEKDMAEKSKLLVTPFLSHEDSWVPDNLARGWDYFVTTQFYADSYYQQYNFKSTSYSASATALGLLLQNALQTAGTLDYKTVSSVLSNNNFHLFYSFSRTHV